MKAFPVTESVSPRKIPVIATSLPLLKANEHPQYIKYMGSKSKIIDFVIDGIESVYNGGKVCDLFSGSCSLSGALGNQVPMVSNDIQVYSAILAKAYLIDWNDKTAEVTPEKILTIAAEYQKKHYPFLDSSYSYQGANTLKSFNEVDNRNRKLIYKEFDGDFHLFVKYYSGTWWSAAGWLTRWGSGPRHSCRSRWYGCR